MGGQLTKGNPVRILIFRGGALGDLMLTLPAIAALRRRFPNAYLELTARLPAAKLALTAGLVDRVQSLDAARMALFFQKKIKLPPDEGKYIRSFDLIVSYLHDPDGIFPGNLREAGARRIIAASPLVESGHAAAHFFKALQEVVGGALVSGNPCPHFAKCGHGAARPWERFRLPWPQALQEQARLRLLDQAGGRRVIIIHPGSGSLAKNWPAEKFAALAEKIRAQTGSAPLIIGGAADEKPLAIMRSLLPKFAFIVNAPLLDIASLLSLASGYVGNDSGITHLAAALGIPVVALFGPTDPAVWAPPGQNVSIVKSKPATTESLAAITVADVFRKMVLSLKSG